MPTVFSTKADRNGNHRYNAFDQFADEASEFCSYQDGEESLLLSNEKNGSSKPSTYDSRIDDGYGKRSWSDLIRLFSLILIPIIIAFLVAYKLFLSNSSFSIFNFFSDSTYETDDNCTKCPISISYCTDKSFPVMGGADLVSTYDSYDETLTYQAAATAGTPDYKTTYSGYTFYFRTPENQKKFENNPEKYLPQWGGFCSWGMSEEYCPQFAWDSTCLGPDGNWYTWNLFNDKLYFFLKKDPLDYFTKNYETYIKDGNARWKAWFGNKVVLNTRCSKSEDN